jgi:hypothetical protein
MAADPAETRQRFRAAMERNDHAAVVALMAPDIVLNSPIIRTQFQGRDAIGNLMAAVLASFEDLRYTAEMGDGELQMLAFRSRVRGREIDTVDLMRIGADGLVTEITVHIRPIVGLASVAAALGPRVARGRLAAFLLRLLAAPLPALLAPIEPVVRRFARLSDS